MQLRKVDRSNGLSDWSISFLRAPSRSCMYVHALTCRRIKDGPVPPLPPLSVRCGPRVVDSTGGFFPHFSCQIEKRAACVIYARDFSPAVAPAAPCSCVHCTYRCRTDRVVSRLYRRTVPVSLYRPSTWRPEENLRLT